MASEPRATSRIAAAGWLALLGLALIACGVAGLACLVLDGAAAMVAFARRRMTP